MPEGYGDFLELLGERDGEQVRTQGRTLHLESGDQLFHAGEPGESVAVLLRGRVKITHPTPKGRELVLGFRGPGDLVGELAVIDGRPRSSSVTAVEPLEVLVIPAGTFRALLDTSPQVARVLLRVLVRRFRDADLKRLEFGASDTVGRVAARLVELTENHGEQRGDAVAITLPLTQEELGGFVGASRAGVTSALRTLRQLGWIETDRKRILIRDLDALRRRSVQD